MHSDIYTLHHCLQTGQVCIGISNGSVLSGKGGALARKTVIALQQAWALPTDLPRALTGPKAMEC
jgi:hypothetical protein